ncbi:MAG TPA: arsenate reductase ArsC [Sumerlaeia bacterium]|nr:arsenate reductase ArsC [Sumerlaeia bacterium]
MRRILFLCTGNCVRSQMAEALLNHRAAGRFEAFSAGSNPAGFVHGMTLQALAELNVPTRRLRSKSWDEFRGRELDAVITLCHYARDEQCPYWPAPPGRALPVRAHWGFEDPSTAQVFGVEEHLEEFRKTRDAIRERIERLAIAPDEVLDDDQAFARLIHAIAADAPNP